ncbi:hypothetical protein [Paludibacterium paludis]|nr:hypothetical protein [Paludibacterium paludis]
MGTLITSLSWITPDKFSLDQYFSIVSERKKNYKEYLTKNNENNISNDNTYDQEVNFSGSVIFPDSKDKVWSVNGSVTQNPGNFSTPRIAPEERLLAYGDKALHRDALTQMHQNEDYLKYKVKVGYGFIINTEQADITNAFTSSHPTANKVHMPFIKEINGKQKIMAKSINVDFLYGLDKNFKLTKDGKIQQRAKDDTLRAVQKHVKKGRERYMEEAAYQRDFTEVLFVPKNDAQDLPLCAFLDFSTNFEAMDKETLNIYLYHNKEDINKLNQKMNDMGFVVFYYDKDTKKRTVAHLVFNGDTPMLRESKSAA